MTKPLFYYNIFDTCVSVCLDTCVSWHSEQVDNAI